MIKDLYFMKPACNQSIYIDKFRLKEIGKSRWATIYENDKMCLSVDDRTIRVSLLDGDNAELVKTIQKFFYENKMGK